MNSRVIQSLIKAGALDSMGSRGALYAAVDKAMDCADTGTAVVNERGTPVMATLVTTAVAVVLIWSGTFQKLVAVASFFLAANYCVSCLALVMLRRREPLRERPFRAWGYPWSAGIVLAVALPPGLAVWLRRRRGQARG